MIRRQKIAVAIATLRTELGVKREDVELRGVAPSGNGTLQIVIEPRSPDLVEDALGETVGSYIGAIDNQNDLFDRTVIDIVLEEGSEITHRHVLFPKWIAAREDGDLDSDELLERVRGTYHIIDSNGEVHKNESIVEWLEMTSE